MNVDYAESLNDATDYDYRHDCRCMRSGVGIVAE